MTDPREPEMTPEEERRVRLREEMEIPDLLVRALDRVPDFWDVLWVQRELRKALEDGQHPERLEKTLETLPPNNSAARSLRLQLRRSKTHLAYLEEFGFGFNFDKGMITTPTPGAPRGLLRGLLEALHAEIREAHGRIPRRQELAILAPILAPFFGPEWTSTDSKGPLARTFDNIG